MLQSDTPPYPPQLYKVVKIYDFMNSSDFDAGKSDIYSLGFIFLRLYHLIEEKEFEEIA